MRERRGGEKRSEEQLHEIEGRIRDKIKVDGWRKKIKKSQERERERV